jgi:alkane 1-monooxygenase
MTQWQMAYRLHPRAFRRGVLIQSLLLLTYAFIFGGIAALVWLYLSWVAIRLLEAVNYFQHYGLTTESAAGHHTAWRCDGAVSFFLFLGLTRHADHHRRPMAPFDELRPEDEGPELPMGYLGTAVWVKNHSRSYGRFAQGRLQTLAARDSATDISRGNR